jgi:hypothetical protein
MTIDEKTSQQRKHQQKKKIKKEKNEATVVAYHYPRVFFVLVPTLRPQAVLVAHGAFQPHVAAVFAHGKAKQTPVQIFDIYFMALQQIAFSIFKLGFTFPKSQKQE